MRFRLLLCLLVAACLSPTAVHAQSLNSAAAGDAGIPANAIIPFATSCPTGYTEVTAAAGRAIIGTGSYSESFRGNSFSVTYALGDIGGVAAYRINTTEMPRHSHGLSWSQRRGNTYRGRAYFQDGSCGTPREGYCGAPESNSRAQGGGSAFDNRQPYIALTLCRKL